MKRPPIRHHVGASFCRCTTGWQWVLLEMVLPDVQKLCSVDVTSMAYRMRCSFSWHQRLLASLTLRGSLHILHAHLPLNYRWGETLPTGHY